MNRQLKISASAGALVLGVLAFNPAWADFSGTLQGDYANLTADSGGGTANDWGGSASGRFSLGSWGLSGLNGQLDGGYHEVSFSGTGGGSLDTYNVNGTLFWLGSMGRVGAVVGYDGLDLSSFGAGTVTGTNYGAFGEWYGGPSFTVGVKGGGISFNQGAGSADYFGGEASWYVIPDVAVTGTIDYMSLSSTNVTTYGGNVEWLPFESTPVSISGGYSHTEVSGGGGFNTLMFSLKLYTNSNGSTTLVDRQRTGNVGWANQVGQNNLVGLAIE